MSSTFLRLDSGSGRLFLPADALDNREANRRISFPRRSVAPAPGHQVAIPRKGVKFGTARNARRGSAVLGVTLATVLCTAQVARRQERPSILAYIKQTWHTLTRTN